MSQKETVFNTVVSYCADKKIKREGKLTTLTKEQKAEVVGLMVQLTKQGVVEVKSEKERKDLKKYWNGTVGNWLTKDIRLNGGKKYEPKTKKGPREPSEVKELRKLLAAVTEAGNAETIALVQAELDKKEAEIANAKVDTIDASKLPESLRHLV